MLTRRSGGSAETETIVPTVSPSRPAAPSVVTTVTPVTAADIASRNSSRSTARAGTARSTVLGRAVAMRAETRGSDTGASHRAVAKPPVAAR